MASYVVFADVKGKLVVWIVIPAVMLANQEAQAKGLDISMFDRLLSMGMEYTLLTDQCRMHPCISAFPSWRFYRGELMSAVTDADRLLPSGLPFRSDLPRGFPPRRGPGGLGGRLQKEPRGEVLHHRRGVRGPPENTPA